MDAAATSTPTTAPCPVAFTGPNPSRADVERDISELATEQNAVIAANAAALGNPPPNPTDGRLSDEQAALLAAAPKNALTTLSTSFCTDTAVSTGMVDRLNTVIASAIPDSVEEAPRIREEITAASVRHPVSILLGTTFDVCALGAPGSGLTRETNPLASDIGAITIVGEFCPASAALFDPRPTG